MFQKTLFKILKSLLIFTIVITWVFSGWPQIQFKKEQISLNFPPKIQEAKAGSEVFTAGGTFSVPAGVTTITVKAWGAGGGGAGGGLSLKGGDGGGGGFTQADIAVTEEDLTVLVGGGGGGGIADITVVGGGGGGGGYSAVKRGATFLIQAGGGGGGGSSDSNVEAGGPGGAGGGAEGVAGTDGENKSPGEGVGGGAGTASGGGAGGNDGTGDPGIDGSANQGGAGGSGGVTNPGGAAGTNGGAAGGYGNSDDPGGGGGGGGRFGGGGGESGVAEGAGGGGGGSDLVTGSNTTETAGSGTLPGNSDDTDRAGAGDGGVGGAISTTGTAGDDGIVVISWVAPAFTLEQVAYRWFQNDNSTAVKGAGGINTAVTAPTQGTPFRLRLLFHINQNNCPLNGTTTKLQYAVRSGTCDTGFVDESYDDVSDSAGNIRYYNNPDAGATDGAALIASTFDPRHSTTTGGGGNMCTVINQDYEEANTFTNSEEEILRYQDGLWDFSLIDFSAPAGTTYCFRAVQEQGGELDAYTVIPEITTAQRNKVRLRGTVRLRIVRLF